jgi:hypothetical protein
MFLSSRELHFFEKSVYVDFAKLDLFLKEDADVYLEPFFVLTTLATNSDSVKSLRLFSKAAPRFELGIENLQSTALPLGHTANLLSSKILQDVNYCTFDSTGRLA